LHHRVVRVFRFISVRTGAGVGMKKPTKYLWNKMKDDFVSY